MGFSLFFSFSMGSTANLLMSAMLILGLLVTISLDSTVAQVGVCYGRNGVGLPSPCEVVGIYDQYNIPRMRIYDPDPQTLEALNGFSAEFEGLSHGGAGEVGSSKAQSGSHVEVTLGILNPELPFLAGSQENADAWVRNNVKKYPNVRFKHIVVGNEVSPYRGDTSRYVPFVFPAMRNVYNAISAAGLGNQIGVSTAIDTVVLGKSYPPEDGEFKSDATSYLDPIIQFLLDRGEPLFVNVYPYFAYIQNREQINRAYALSQPNSGIFTPSGTRYENLFYALVDAVYAALEKRTRGRRPPKIVVGETGWPSGGGDSEVANLENARIYNTNLIEVARNGTPKRPGEPIETYIFAMFDENQKDGNEEEKHFGIFQSDGQPKYPISFD